MRNYQDAVITKSGGQLVAVVGAAISVFKAGTRTLATLYSNNSFTALANPLTTDTNGNYSFYAADGRYDVEIVAQGYPTSVFPDIILEDPRDNTILTVASASTISPDAAVSSDFYVSITTTPLTIANPVNMVDGQILRFYLTQGGSGSNRVILDTKFHLQNNATFSASTAAGAVDVLEARYVKALDTFLCLQFLNFNAAAPASTTPSNPTPGSTSPNPTPNPTPTATVTYPTPRNANFILVGDSRFANSTTATTSNLSGVEYQTSWGVAEWIMANCSYKAKLTGNFAKNGETLSTIIARMPSTADTQSNFQANPAGTAIVLCGVNDTNSDISVTGPKYHTLVDGLLASGFVVILLNELPNGNAAGNGAIQFARRTYLDNYVPADATKTSMLIKFNSYDLLADSPTTYGWGVGYHETADTVPLHPNQRGNRVLGISLGGLMGAMLSNSTTFPARDILPKLNGAEAGFCVSNQFAGTGGSLGAGATGVMPANWNGDALPTGITCAYSVTTDPDGYGQLTLTIGGTPTVANAGTGGCAWSIHNYSNSALGASGDTVYGVARALIASGNTGLSGVSLRMDSVNTTNSITLETTAFAADGFSSDTYTQRIGSGYPTQSFDLNLVTPDIVLGSGWTAAATKAHQMEVRLYFIVGVAASAVVKFSRAGIKLTSIAAPATPTTSRAFPVHTTLAAGMLKPNNVTQTQMDNTLKARYDSMHAFFDRNRNITTSWIMYDYGDAYINMKRYDSWITTSEAAGYGMLITAVMGGYDSQAQTKFNKLFAFARRFPANSMNLAGGVHRYLMAWLITKDANGNATAPDQYGAGDGDLDMALGLFMAHAQWGSAGTVNYLAEGLNMTNAMKVGYFQNGGVSYTNGTYSSTSARTSDFMLNHFRTFATYDTANTAFWNGCITKMQNLSSYMISNYSAQAGLIPDWIIGASGTTPYPSGPSQSEPTNSQNHIYYFNACRNPWRFMTDSSINGDANSQALSKQNAFFWRNVAQPAGQAFNAENIRGGYYLDGTPYATSGTVHCFSGPAMCTQMLPVDTVYGKGGDQTSLNNFWAYHSTTYWGGYYDGEIQFMSMLVASGNWWQA